MRLFLGVLAVAGTLAGSVAAWAETTVDIRPRLEPEPAPSERIHIGYVNGTISLDRAKLELSTTSHVIAGTLTLAYSSNAPQRNLVVPLALPRGAAIRRLVATTGLAAVRPHSAHANATPNAFVGQRLVGKPRAASEARELYDDLIYGNRDPALLSLQGRDATAERFSLEVFPIGHGSPGVVEIAFEVPHRASSIVLDPDGALVDRVELVVDGRASTKTWVSEPIAIALRGKPAPRAVRAGLVTAERSLVAAPHGARRLERPRVIVCGIGHTSPSESGVSAKVIRKTVRRAQPRLLHCFMKTAQANPLLAGTANLHFTIEDGRTREIEIDGDLDHPEIRSCMAREIASWQFPRAATPAAHPERIRVNYPLQLSAR